MNKRLVLHVFVSVVFAFCLCSAKAQGTAFTYQGRLNANGAAVAGDYDFVFALYNDSQIGSQVGTAETNSAVTVSGGLFTTTLDFGGTNWNGQSLWLQILVRTNGASGFTALSPRQPVTPAPYAITASNLSGTLPAGQLSGTILNASLPASAIFSGTVTANNLAGNGAGVTNVNAAALGGLTVGNFWQLGGNNVSGGQFVGSTNNQSVELWVGNQRALLITTNPADSANVIGGSPVNGVDAGVRGAVIAGGGSTNFLGAGSTNHISADFSSIGGGSANQIQAGADHSVIAGGWGNVIQSNAYESVISGGQNNIVSNQYAAIVGGLNNTNIGYGSIVSGGQNNWIQYPADRSSIGGGYGNAIVGVGAANTGGVIGGGFDNQILTNASYATIGGGVQNYIYNNASGSWIGGGVLNKIYGNGSGAYTLSFASIGGGYANTIATNSSGAGILGGYQNTIQSNASYSTIGGGNGNNVWSQSSTIGGGSGNTVSSPSSTIGGGTGNAVSTNASCATLAGGQNNSIGGFANDGFIGGGYANVNGGPFSVLGGGYQNMITPGNAAVIGGGYQNLILTNSYEATIAGGWTNVIGTNAYQATIAGGAFNFVSGVQATIGGGAANQATNTFATIPGGQNNVAGGQFSFAAGQQAYATNTGAFVWADSQNAPFGSTTTNQFSVRANGGVQFVTSGAGMTLDGYPVLSSASHLVNAVGSSSTGAAAFIGGGINNTNTGYTAFIGGGIDNVATGYASFIGGGGDNYAGNVASGSQSAVVGGVGNYATANYTAIGGGYVNEATNTYATVAGGGWNLAAGQFAAVGGGYYNWATNDYSTVPGGEFNTAGGQFSFAAGLEARALHNGTFVWADSQNLPLTSTTSNQFLLRAQGGVGIDTASTVEGSLTVNTNIYLDDHPIYLRGKSGTDHNHGLAYCGSGATNFAPSVLPDGPVLWGFSGGALGAMNGGAHALLSWNPTTVNIAYNSQTTAPVLSVNGNRNGDFNSPIALFQNSYLPNILNAAPVLRVICTGNTPDGALSVSTEGTGLIARFGNATQWVADVQTNGTVDAIAFNTTSDRNAKKNFSSVDPSQVLEKVAALPITEWSYKVADGIRHIGPMAQDFQAAFQVGSDDRHIATVDADGVALAAIKGLNEKVEYGRRQEANQIEQLKAENADLKTRLEKLERLLEQKGAPSLSSAE